MIAIYEQQSAGRGRRSVSVTDLLRAAVVLLHATLEDLVRSLMEWKLPAAPAEAFKDMNLAGITKNRFSLDDVALHRGKTVDQLIAESVSQSLERSNYNNTNEIAAALNRVSLDPMLTRFGADHRPDDAASTLDCASR